MKDAIYDDVYLWLMAIIFGYFCYPIIKYIVLYLIGGQ